jgi:hypothetical protein
MYKTLCAAVLLVGVFALAGRNSAAIPAASLTSPQIVAKVALTNQSGEIPTKTIFIPPQTGLYRVSPYMAMTSGLSNGGWNLYFGWTDEGGQENDILMFLSGAPPSFGRDGQQLGTTVGGFTFRAVAGQPVTYYTLGSGSGTYELFLTVERLQ